MFMTTP